MSVIRTTAWAKINFWLEITGKRPDGYHTLDINFQTISLGDRLSFRPARSLRLRCSDPALPVDDRNIAMKAARRLQAELKESRGAAIYLKKVVPMGAGLGGGSADAAAVLTGLLRLWKRRLPPATLQRLAVELGADVPFFLKGGYCRAGGIGDQLRPQKPLPILWLVLVWPGFGVNTKHAYSKVRLPFADGAAGAQSVRLGRSPVRLRLFNRFESLVFPDHPELPALKDELLRMGCRGALMSGSGSAVYGIVDSAAAGRRILKELRSRYRHSWLVRTVNAAPRQAV